MNSGPFRIAVITSVIFFLTFLGMRLHFLDKSKKPKPRPRAVINLLAKSVSGSTLNVKHDLHPCLDVLEATPTATEIRRTFSKHQYAAFQASSLRVPELLFPKGRSPPHC